MNIRYFFKNLIFIIINKIFYSNILKIHICNIIGYSNKLTIFFKINQGSLSSRKKNYNFNEYIYLLINIKFLNVVFKIFFIIFLFYNLLFLFNNLLFLFIYII